MKFSEHIINADDGPLKDSTPPMVDLGKYKFKYLNMGKNNRGIFMNNYVGRV